MHKPYHFSNLIKKVGSERNLMEKEAMYAAEQIMSGDAAPLEVEELLSLLAKKGETYKEISGFAKIMRSKAIKIIKPKNHKTVDIVGTGGDGHHTINISTLAAIVTAGAGIYVAKHGNRAVSSASGSADVLEALGVNINTEPEKTESILSEVGIAFLFAQKLHLAMKNVAPIRKKMGIRTIFNILGPLTNPAFPDALMLGVYSKDYIQIMVQSLRSMGVKEAIVVHSEDGMDEISVSSETRYAHLKNKKVTEGIIIPEDIIGKRYSLEDIKGGNASENANIAKALLKGNIIGAKKEVVLINAGAAIMVAGKADSIKDGYAIAKGSLESGKAYQKLNQLILVSNG